MAEDKAKDDELFNCGEDYETDYVVSLYPKTQKDDVRQAIENGCNDGTIKDWTHADLYSWLKRKGYTKS